MSKIEFILKKFEKSLVCQVLKLDERFKNVDRYKSCNGMFIDYGTLTNSMADNIIFLKYSKFPFNTCFESNKERDIYHDKMIEALKDCCKNWEGFKDDKPNNPNKPDIFEFNGKIKFSLHKFVCGLGFQVLEMDDRFRCHQSDNVYKSKEYTIVSDQGHPIICNLDERIIYVRGNTKINDYNIDITMYDNNGERDSAYTEILKSVKEWSENWSGFIEVEKSEDGIYKF